MLAARLPPLAGADPVVVAIPRGGVPVAFEIARALDAPLEILAVRKIGAARNPEFAVGAIAEDGSCVIDTALARDIGMSPEVLDAAVERELGELRRRVAAYRGGSAPLDVRGRTVVLVDDGLATGLTDLVGVRALRALGAARIVVAVPVGAREAVRIVGDEADEIVCVATPYDLLSVGLWYRDFSQVSDDEVIDLLAQAATRMVTLSAGGAELDAELTVPAHARGLVLFAHGSGSGRRSPRNQAVAAALNERGFATLLFDLLTAREARRRELAFDSPLLAERLVAATDWAATEPATSELPVGYFGASTGAAATMRAAAMLGDRIGAVVSRGGRADLAGDMLPQVRAPTLLIVGSRDRDVLALNRLAAERLTCPHRVAIVEGAGHLFEEPGALEEVAGLAGDWFTAHLPTPVPTAA